MKVRIKGNIVTDSPTREYSQTFVLIRLAFIEDYTLKSLRLKPEKWNKLVISDDQRGFLHSFVDQGRMNG